MFSVSLEKNQQATITSDLLPLIRERFSIANPAYGKGAFVNKFTPKRQYVITPGGKFDIGLYGNIVDYLNSEGYNILREEKVLSTFSPKINNTNIIELNLKLREYQKDSINAALAHGRGVIVLPTGAGKTLTIATLINSININKDKKFLIIVPTIQLIRQTYSDFLEYGISSEIMSKWSGDDEPDLKCNIVVAGLQILQSQSDKFANYLNNIDVLIIDECHKLRRKNEFNNILKLIKTPYRFGFTGTMPPDLIDQWNIIGKIGPILFEKQSIDLREHKQIANICVQILRFNYINKPSLAAPNNFNPKKAFDEETEFLINSPQRNTKIATICKATDKNTLVIVERIQHGETLFNYITDICKDKKVYFIQGSVEVNDRERIRSIMEEEHNIVCIAVSKIFSEGINIKNLHYIVFAASSKAKIKILQTIGRGVRLHPLKNMLYIFDIADNLRYSNKHVKERIKIYETEKIQYKETEVQV